MLKSIFVNLFVSQSAFPFLSKSAQIFMSSKQTDTRPCKWETWIDCKDGIIFHDVKGLTSSKRSQKFNLPNLIVQQNFPPRQTIKKYVSGEIFYSINQFFTTYNKIQVEIFAVISIFKTAAFTIWSFHKKAFFWIDSSISLLIRVEFQVKCQNNLLHRFY